MLDSETPTGALWIERQGLIATAMSRRFECDVIQTAPGPASIDALLSRAGRLVACAEIKCRNLTLAQLRQYGSYVITRDKIDRGLLTAYHLRAPLWLVVGLWPERLIVWWEARPDWPSRFSVTRRNCNDDSVIERENMYVPLDTMRILQ